MFLVIAINTWNQYVSAVIIDLELQEIFLSSTV